MRYSRYAAPAAVALVIGICAARPPLHFVVRPPPAPAASPAPLARIDAPPAALALDRRFALPPPVPDLDLTPVGALGSSREPVREAPDRPVLTPAAPPLPPLELSRFTAAAALYRKGAVPAGDALAAQISDPAQRVALEWVALRSVAAPDAARLAAFAAAHKDWPAAEWIRDTQEGGLYATKAGPAVVQALFRADPPHTSVGVLAAARAARDLGDTAETARLIRTLWRERDLDGWTEGAILKEFGALLTRADHKYRADRLLYAERIAPALRAAALAGPDEVALANARIEAMRGPLSPRSIAAIPASLQTDPGLIFARVQDARRGNRTPEASAWLALAPKDPAALIDPDKWWTERRMVAREWLDRGQFKSAYQLCADAPTVSVPARVDAAFHAGWIALRFLDDPHAAARHFADAGAVALTPLAIARSSYWQGRAAEAAGEGDLATRFYGRAASYPIAYYGQLAARRLGRDGPFAPRVPQAVATGGERWEATRSVELYYAAGLDDFATGLAFAAASTWTDEAQVAALGEVVQTRASATVNVEFGKIATERGFALDNAAFPLSGLPSFAPLPHSADLASVLAVSRQESEFMGHAASGAGAKGLMQILPATAAMTARRAGIAFDFSRLIGDPGYNLQLGAAYLGQLIDDEGGSLEMALAAYNAGQGRVAQWIAAYGDPRTGAIDPVDWVERIPFDETRDYVQRVSENLGVYRARLGGPASAPGARLAGE